MIEDNIPFPSKQARRPQSLFTKSLISLEVSQSFTYPCSYSVWSKISRATTNNPILKDRAFVSRKEDGIPSYRIWRVVSSIIDHHCFTVDEYHQPIIAIDLLDLESPRILYEEEYIDFIKTFYIDDNEDDCDIACFDEWYAVFRSDFIQEYVHYLRKDKCKDLSALPVFF